MKAATAKAPVDVGEWSSWWLLCQSLGEMLLWRYVMCIEMLGERLCMVLRRRQDARCWISWCALKCCYEVQLAYKTHQYHLNGSILVFWFLQLQTSTSSFNCYNLYKLSHTAIFNIHWCLKSYHIPCMIYNWKSFPKKQRKCTKKRTQQYLRGSTQIY